jgi:hypothetical protein
LSGQIQSLSVYFEFLELEMSKTENVFSWQLAGLILFSASSLFATSASELREKINSPDWKCDFTHKVNLAHSSDGKVADPVLTLARVKCVGLNAKAGHWEIYRLSCKASSRDSVSELAECAKDAELDTDKYSWDEGVISKSATKTGSDKHGRKCVYDTQTKKPLVSYRLKTDGSYDAVCATPIACDNFSSGPKHFVVACKSLGEVPIKGGGSYDICPQPNDCVENELPLQFARSQTELAALSDRGTVTATPNAVVSSKQSYTSEASAKPRKR